MGLALMCAACSGKVDSARLINQHASLPSSFNFSGMGLKVITSSINSRKATMSTLYGNGPALERAIAGTATHEAGEVYALVTWRQQEDPKWFGARIPGELQTVELIRTARAKGEDMVVSYRKFKGKKLALDPDTLQQQARITYIFGQKPSVTP